MDKLIKLVRRYQLTEALDEQLRLIEEIIRLIEPDLRFYVFKSVRPSIAEDALQEALIAVATGAKKFKGGSSTEFWAWCYRITRNKLNDQFRKQASGRLQPLPPEEILQLMDLSTQPPALTPGGRRDLEYAMNLLARHKPECYDYLWKYFVVGQTYAEIAKEQNLSYDAVRMKIGRCLKTAQSLVSSSCQIRRQQTSKPNCKS